jgi:maltose O-acetyltransferase
MSSSEEKAKMINGEIFNPNDELLVAEHKKCVELTTKFNNYELLKILGKCDCSPVELLKEILGTCDESTFIEAPCHFGYGYNIHVGKRFYANYGLVIDDECKVVFGDNCMVGPGVHIYAATHSTDHQARLSGQHNYGKLVTIGNNVWIGGRSVILPGITIGDNAVIGAGSVVTRNVPSNTIVVGNPAKILRSC